MTNHADTITPTDRNIARIHNLGSDIIAKHNKYTNYTTTQIWTVGLGSLIDNHDVRDYDPAVYSDIELLVLALQDKFKDIGGPGVHALEYIKLLRKYYSETAFSVLRLTIVSSMENTRMSPVIITNIYHPQLLKLHVRAANENNGKDAFYTDSELGLFRDMIDDVITDVMMDITSM